MSVFICVHANIGTSEGWMFFFFLSQLSDLDYYNHLCLMQTLMGQSDIYHEVIAKLVVSNAIIVCQFCNKMIILGPESHHCFTPFPIIRPRKKKGNELSGHRKNLLPTLGHSEVASPFGSHNF